MSALSRLKVPALPESLRTQHRGKVLPIGLAGAALIVVGSFLAWSYDPTVLGDLSISGYPGGLQILAILLAVVAALLLLLGKGPLRNVGTWVNTSLGLRALATGTLIYAAGVLIGIAQQSGGLINIDPGGWVSFVGSLLLAVGGTLLEP